MQHLEEGTIHAWLDGELSAAEQAQAERHVAECADCAAAVAEARGMIAGASRIVSALDVVRGAGGGGVVPRQPAKPAAARSVWHSLRLTPTRAALAASLLVAAGAVFTVNHSSQNMIAPVASAPRSDMSAQSAGPLPAPSPTASPAPTITTAMDSTAMRAVVAPVAKKTVGDRSLARTEQPSVLAAATHADSLRREVQSVNASAAAPASVAATEKVVAPPPSAPAFGGRTASSLVPSGYGAAGPVVADRVREPSRAALDSLDAKRPDSVRAAPESRRQFNSAPLQLSEVVATGARSTLDIAGCYQIKPDSSTLLHLLPNRFALERTAGAAAPNTVWSVAPDGRKDSVLTGTNWVQISNGKAQIQSTVGTKHQVVYLQLTSLGGVSGEASTPSGPRPFGVARATCRP